MFKEIIFPDLTSPWRLIDDDFTETVRSDGISQAVIETYEKHNLPVAVNLIKAILWWRTQSHYSVEIIINAMKNECPKYINYADEIDKYLTIL